MLQIMDRENENASVSSLQCLPRKEFDCCCETAFRGPAEPQERDECAYGDSGVLPVREPDTVPRTYDLKAMLNSTRYQINEYVDKMNWKSVGMADQCGFVHLLLMLFAIYATVLRRACAQFTAVPTAVGIAVQFAQFLTGRLLDIANTRNGRDRATKAAVLCAQCTVLATVVGLFVLVYAPVVRLLVQLLVFTMNAPLLVSSVFY